MDAPSSFVSRLTNDFAGRLRVRWSVKDHTWMIEEKVGRAALPPLKIDEGRDDLIRARDGYALVLTIHPSDRMPCPRCRETLKVPVFKAAEVVCEKCSTRQNRRVAYKAAYWPLSESLLDYLHKIDPLRTGNVGLAAEMDAHNNNLRALQERDQQNFGEAVLKDSFSEIMQIPSVGYTGKEKYQD